MQYGALPPEINSGLMYAGSGAGPMLAAASAWDGLAAELHSAAAGYNSVIAGLTSEGWLGPASTLMATAAAPYAAWMSATAAQAEQTAAQARAAVAAYEAAFTATVPPPVIAANRVQLATLVATNILGQNTPAIAANEAHYAEMWAQDVTAMYGYDAAAKPASALNQFNQPPQTTNPAGTAQTLAVGQAAANAAGTHAQSAAAAATPTMPSLSDATSLLSSSQAGDVRNAVSWATFLPQNGSYMFSIVNALQALARSVMPAAGGAAAAAAATNAVGAVAPAAAGLGGLGGVGVLTGALGQSGTIGALSVPQAWAAASPLTGSVGSSLGGVTLAAAHSAVGPNPAGMLNGMPMLANAAARSVGDHSAAMPRFDLRPSVIPMSPAAG